MALSAAESLGPLILIAALALTATAALWWIYSWPPHQSDIASFTGSLRYGYGHFFVFAAAGAFSADIEVEIDVLTHHSTLSQPLASLAYTIPLSVFILGIWVLAIRPNADSWVNTSLPVAAVLVLIDPLLPMPFALTAVILTAAVSVLVWRRPLASRDGRSTSASVPVNG